MSEAPKSTEKCLECLSEIDAAAVKCSHCGAYQNWRRFMPFGESTLALVLSAIALAAVFLPDPKAPLKEINDYLSRTNFAMSVSLIKIEADAASVLVENRENSPAAMNSFVCLLNLPLDPHMRIIESLKARRDAIADDTERPLIKSETMGIFQIAYELKEPVLVRPYESAILTLPVAHISPPLHVANPKKPNDEATNFCLVRGTNFEDGLAGGGVIIKPSQLNNIDLLNVLENADYGEQREHERAPDISLVRDARAKNPKLKLTFRKIYYRTSFFACS